MNLVIVAQPTSEPVDLDTAKNFCRVTTDADDTLVLLLISAAREACEAFTGRSIATKTYRQGLDCFPYYIDTAVNQMSAPTSQYNQPLTNPAMWNYSQQIKLFAPPLVSVLSISYTDPNNVDQTLDSSEYIVDSDSEPARVFPGPAGGTWPSCLYVPNAVEIEFVAGYSTDPSTAQEVPAALQLAILILTASYYENRETHTAGSFGEIPNHVQRLLWAYKVMNEQPTRG